MFDRPVQTESESSPKKCTCLQRQSRRPQSSPISSQPPIDSTLRVNTPPNRHSSLMQTAALSAYHTGEPQRSSIKSCSLVNDTYEFVDNTKKISYLTGSARCTLVTASATMAATHANTNNHAHLSHNTISSRIRFRKSNNR